MSRLLIGVTGSIAAFKALELVRLAVADGHAVRVVQTPATRRFVGPDSFVALTGAPVLVSEFDPDPLRGAYPGEREPERVPIAHLALVQRADAYLIAPATAQTLAQLAGGHADTFVTTAALAADCPVLVAPAMNDRMWAHPATRANVALLAARGVTIVGPGEGELASHGEHGAGRMSEPPELLAAVRQALGGEDGRVSDGHAGRGEGAQPHEGAPPQYPARAWAGRRVLVTAGGTREPIDSVRFIGNRSSGRMGYALATRAAARGARVTLVAANVALPDPDGVTVVPVSTAAELAAACEHAFADCDVLLMAAAVADFRPRDPAAHKLKKQDGVPQLALEPTPDVLTGLAARRRPGQVLVGFAAEHGAEAIANARVKRERKHLDAVVVNDISRPGIGFDTPDNEVTVVDARSETQLVRAGKDAIADGVLDRVGMLLHTEEGEDVHRTGAHRTAGV